MSVTRKEWLAAFDRVDEYNRSGFVTVGALTEAALGCPCPPEPAPEFKRRTRGGSDLELGEWASNTARLTISLGLKPVGTSMNADDLRVLADAAHAMADHLDGGEW